MITIGKIIYNTLTTAGVKAFPIVAPEQTTLPFVVFERSFTAEYTKDGRAYNDNTVSIYILSEDYQETINIASTVDNAFDGLNGNYDGLQIFNTRLHNCEEVYNNGTYIQKLVYEMKSV